MTQLTPCFQFDTQALKALKKFLSPMQVTLDEVDLKHYGRDWTKIFPPKPSAVLFPKSIEDVRNIVIWANEFGIALVPSGGRTGLSGAAVASSGEVVVSFDRMNRIRDFYDLDHSVVVEAGVVTQQLQEFAEEKGLFYPVDFASAGSSQIGGNINTNAGGIKVIRYGMTRDSVLGLKVVTGRGDILNLNQGLIKNATGYDLRHLLIGSEGTLAFVVEATMRLEPPPKALTAMVLAIPSLTTIMSVFHEFRKGIELTAFEFFSDVALSKILARGDVPEPFATRTPYYVLLEFDAYEEKTLDNALNIFEKCMTNHWALDGVISQSETQLQNLWKLREYISETISHFTPYKNDISVCVRYVTDFLEKIDVVVNANYPDFDVVWFGHIGDGNLHLNILKPETWSLSDFAFQCQKVNQLIFDVVREYGGSISAEHGVGLTKKDYLDYSRSEIEIQIMRDIKKVFDPNGIMNPGKIFSLESSQFDSENQTVMGIIP